jgi:hypothetical protein
MLQSHIAACLSSPFVKVGNMAMASLKSSRADCTRTHRCVETTVMVESGEGTRVLAHL